jgi:AcrR family transcriptional regulator
MSPAPKRLSRAERRAETRTALLEAAGRVFVERGFHGASVEAIAEEAGYTRGAFYSNFASKEDLFAELLQEQAFAAYRELAAGGDPTAPLTPREVGERAAAMLARDEGHWRFRLWLELLAHAGRDERFRHVAAGFWSGTRAIGAETIRRTFEEAGATAPADVRDLASTVIALDIGLALQHFVDPEAVPLDLYPRMFELVLDRLGPGGGDGGPTG